MTSTPPPAPNGSMIRTGRSGKAWSRAATSRTSALKPDSARRDRDAAGIATQGRPPWPPGWESSKRDQGSVRGIEHRRGRKCPSFSTSLLSPIVHAAVPASTALRGSSPVTGRGAPAVTAAHCAGEGRGHVPVLAFARISGSLPASSACRAGYGGPPTDAVRCARYARDWRRAR